MPIDFLLELLEDVRRGAGHSFSGIGVLVSDDPDGLPIVPLRPLASTPTFGSTRELLIAVSNKAHELHDGFHIMSSDLCIVRFSQYFSPSIVPGLVADPARRRGGRYMAAMFGSTLRNVVVSGVASADYGVAVFEGGREVRAA
ncbi:hypothetical protein [Methylobacterium bullatum]|uniref:hypothetical protein n=1 Tax=Methylobacterium bullatum TaxID=570505 RepID=UPI00178488DF|nr:hypothetical protein [Methylobacterium bullatum]MBD8902571.1 hypothetical protein [Methylobacterium bullatum]